MLDIIAIIMMTCAVSFPAGLLIGYYFSGKLNKKSEVQEPSIVKSGYWTDEATDDC